MNLNSLFEMIRFFSILMLLMIMSIFSLSGKAVEVHDLYQARVPIIGQLKNNRTSAIKQAMTAVFIKVGGDKSIIDHKVFQQALKRPDNYYIQYQYEKLDKTSYLVVDFDSIKINQLFKQANTPIWGSLRPQVLVWLVAENKFSRNILASSSDSPLLKRLSILAKQRGLPLIFPLMDLDDINSLSITDVWGRFAEPVNIASARYQPEKIVIIRVSDYSLIEPTVTQEDCTSVLCQQKSYSVDWSIIDEGNQVFSQSYNGAEPETLLAQSLDDITGIIYQQYALSTSSNNDVLIDVDNIGDIKSYVGVFKFLKTLSSVQSIILVEAKNNHRRFKLNILGEKSALMASLKLSKQLTLYVDPLAEKLPDDIPVFYWKH